MDKKVKMYIYNYEQAYFYMVDCGIKPIERPGVNSNTNTIFFVFDKEETIDAWDKWCNEHR